MPGQGKHTAKWDDCVTQVMAKGKTQSEASAICTVSFQKSGDPIFIAAEAGSEEEARLLGGPGSGNFGHSGVPGEQGGSAAGGSSSKDQASARVKQLHEELTRISKTSDGVSGMNTAARSKEIEYSLRKIRQEHPDLFKKGTLRPLEATDDTLVVLGEEIEETPEIGRHLHLRGAVGKTRRETFEGREYLVVPVTALMEGVIHAVNAPEPEFVPYSVLAKAPQGWDGRPVVLGHPKANGVQISANDPRVLEAQGLGTIFQTKCSSTRQLQTEAWLDIAKSTALGQQQLLKDLEDGKIVEVSVGAFVITQRGAGAHNGRTYNSSWKDMIPDHLAFLPGGRGACSAEMGCGTNRAAEEVSPTYLVTAEGFEEAPLEAAGGKGSGNFGHAGIPGQQGGSAAGVAVAHDKAAAAHEKAAELHRAAKEKVGNTPPEGLTFFDSKAGTAAAKATQAATAATRIATETHTNVLGENQTQTTRATPAAAAAVYSEEAESKDTHLGAARTHDYVAKAHRAAAKQIRSGNLRGLSMNPKELQAHLDAFLKTLSPMGDKAQVYEPGVKVTVSKDGHPADGKSGTIKKSMRGGSLHEVEVDGKSHFLPKSALKTAQEDEAAEEAAELVAYQTMKTLNDQAGTIQDEISSLIDALISAETEDPSESADDESAEEEMEEAQLSAISSLCTAMYGCMSAMLGIVRDQQTEEDEDSPSSGMAGYAGQQDCPACNGTGHADGTSAGVAVCPLCDGLGQMKTAAGARHSATDRQMIQSVHDHSMSLGAKCDPSNVDVRNMEAEPIEPEVLKALRDISAEERKNIPAADFAGPGESFPIVIPEDVKAAADALGLTKHNRGDIKSNIIAIANRKGAEFVAQLPKTWTGKAADASPKAAEEGTQGDGSAAATAVVVPKAAERRQQGEGMTPEQKKDLIKTLVENKHSGFTAGDEAMLEAASDERLESFRVAADARAIEVRNAAEAAAKPKTLTTEEFMAVAPPELKSLIARTQTAETERKTALVVALKAAQSEYTETELSGMSLDGLERLGRLARLEETPDYSGRGIPRAATTASEDVFANPPDPYADGLKALAAQQNTRH